MRIPSEDSEERKESGRAIGSVSAEDGGTGPALPGGKEQSKLALNYDCAGK